MEDILFQELEKIVQKFSDEADFSIGYYSNNTNSLKRVTDKDFREPET